MSFDRIGYEAYGRVEDALKRPFESVDLEGPSEGVGTTLADSSGRDERTVWLRVTNPEPMDWPHHSKKLFPVLARFVYRRPLAEDGTLTPGAWKLYALSVHGRQAKNDGTPGQASADTDWYVGSVLSDSIPAWLAHDAMANLPKED